MPAHCVALLRSGFDDPVHALRRAPGRAAA